MNDETACSDPPSAPKDSLLGKVTCPFCKSIQEVRIPTDRCIPFLPCQGCKQMIVAKTSCCVFCDYGDRPCPMNKK